MFRITIYSFPKRKINKLSEHFVWTLVWKLVWINSDKMFRNLLIFSFWKRIYWFFLFGSEFWQKQTWILHWFYLAFINKMQNLFKTKAKNTWNLHWFYIDFIIFCNFLHWFYIDFTLILRPNRFCIDFTLILHFFIKSM